MNARTLPGYLVSCTQCGGRREFGWSAAKMVVCDVPQPEPFVCGSCQPGLIPADELCQPGRVVHLVGAGAQDTGWVILSRDGDQLTGRPLGLPDWPAQTILVAQVRPEFSHQRLAAAENRARS